MMHKPIIGWDVGGAHLKAALIIEGVVTQVEQHVCPLWKGIEYLAVSYTHLRAHET